MATNHNITTYVEAYNVGYRLGMHGKDLTITTEVFLKGILSKKYYDNYRMGLNHGYSEAMGELKKQKIRERKLEMEKMMGKELDRDGPTMKW